MMENKGKVYDSQLGISVPSSHIFQNHLDTLLQALLYNSTNVNENILISAYFLMRVEQCFFMITRFHIGTTYA